MICGGSKFRQELGLEQPNNPSCNICQNPADNVNVHPYCHTNRELNREIVGFARLVIVRCGAQTVQAQIDAQTTVGQMIDRNKIVLGVNNIPQRRMVVTISNIQGQIFDWSPQIVSKLSLARILTRIYPCDLVTVFTVTVHDEPAYSASSTLNRLYESKKGGGGKKRKKDEGEGDKRGGFAKSSKTGSSSGSSSGSATGTISVATTSDANDAKVLSLAELKQIHLHVMDVIEETTDMIDISVRSQIEFLKQEDPHFHSSRFMKKWKGVFD